MNSKKSLSALSIWVLGAINGLLVGLIVERARIGYLNYQMGRIAQEYAQSEWAVDFVEARSEAIIPLVCIVTFAVVSYLFHRYFINRPRPLLLTWLVMSLIAVWAGYFMSTSNPSVFSFIWLLTIAMLSYSLHRFWKHYLLSTFLMWIVIGISAFLLAAFGVQIVGLLFYWPELRDPLTWLLLFGIVLVINSIYGVLVEIILRRSTEVPPSSPLFKE